MNFLFAAIDPDYDHREIYDSKEAIFDLQPHQSGWNEIKQIKDGDLAAIIKPNRRISLIYKVTKVNWSESKVVVFGVPLERIDKPYEQFIRQYGITHSKISLDHQMLQGFNVAKWESF